MDRKASVIPPPTIKKSNPIAIIGVLGCTLQKTMRTACTSSSIIQAQTLTLNTAMIDFGKKSNNVRRAASLPDGGLVDGGLPTAPWSVGVLSPLWLSWLDCCWLIRDYELSLLLV